MKGRTPDREALDKHAAQQLGLVTRAQARACGFTSQQINRRLREGDWVEVRCHILAERGLPLTPMVLDVAVQLTIPGAVLAGPSAMRWHGIEVPSSGTFVALEQTRHARPPGVIVFRDLSPDEDVCVIDDVCLTTLERTVFDCIRVLPDVAALALLGQALEQGWSTLSELADRTGRFTNRHGAPRLVRLLSTAARGSHSAAERLATRLLERSGVWGWVQDVPIEDRWGLICVGDIVFVGPQLVIELEGRSYDPDSRRARYESQRRDRLLAAGWTPLTFSWHDLSARPDDVVTETKHALSRLGSHAR
jgi:hypothetical protein